MMTLLLDMPVKTTPYKSGELFERLALHNESSRFLYQSQVKRCFGWTIETYVILANSCAAKNTN